MKKYFVILFLLALAIFISGCINILPTLEEEPITPGEGRLKIYLTDSSEKYKANDSENYSAVYITISRIEAHIAGDDEGAEGYWTVLIEWMIGAEPTFDLIELKDKSILLSEEELAIGKYTQIRLFVIYASVDIELGESGVPVQIPSNLQTGLKLIHPFEIVEGETTELTIDFNSEKSIVKTGNGSYKLKPVIKVVTVSTGEVGEED